MTRAERNQAKRLREQAKKAGAKLFRNPFTGGTEALTSDPFVVQQAQLETAQANLASKQLFETKTARAIAAGGKRSERSKRIISRQSQERRERAASKRKRAAPRGSISGKDLSGSDDVKSRVEESLKRRDTGITTSRLAGSLRGVESTFSKGFRGKLVKEARRERAAFETAQALNLAEATKPKGISGKTLGQTTTLVGFKEGAATEFSPGFTKKFSKAQDIQETKAREVRRTDKTFSGLIKARDLTQIKGGVRFRKDPGLAKKEAVLFGKEIVAFGKSAGRGVVKLHKGSFKSGLALLEKDGFKKSFEISKKVRADVDVSAAGTVGVAVALGFGTQFVVQGGIRALAFAGTRLPKIARVLGSPTGSKVLGGLSGVADVGFVAAENVRLAQSKTPVKSLTESAARLGGFGLGSALEKRLLGSATVRKTRFGDPFSRVQAEAELQRIIPSGKKPKGIKEKALSLLGVEPGKPVIPKTEQKLIRELENIRAKRRLKPEPAGRPLTAEVLPAFLGKKQRKELLEVVTDPKLTKEAKIKLFGSLGIKLKLKKGQFRGGEGVGDIDLAALEHELLKTKLVEGVQKVTPKKLNVGREGVGLSKKDAEKIADIKPLARLEEFAEPEPFVLVPKGGGLEATRLSEELGRKLSASRDPKRRAAKGDKDIKDALDIGKGLLEFEIKTAKKAKKVKAPKLNVLKKQAESTGVLFPKSITPAFFDELPSTKLSASQLPQPKRLTFKERIKVFKQGRALKKVQVAELQISKAPKHSKAELRLKKVTELGKRVKKRKAPKGKAPSKIPKSSRFKGVPTIKIPSRLPRSQLGKPSKFSIGKSVFGPPPSRSTFKQPPKSVLPKPSRIASKLPRPSKFGKPPPSTIGKPSKFGGAPPSKIKIPRGRIDIVVPRKFRQTKRKERRFIRKVKPSPKLMRTLEFNPSVVGIETKIKGKKKGGVLTGLGVRSPGKSFIKV